VLPEIGVEEFDQITILGTAGSKVIHVLPNEVVTVSPYSYWSSIVKVMF
jgi:hypothetical protein